MIYQRPIFGGLAAIYCLILGALALYQNRHAKLNRIFAFYNLMNAMWNANEIAVFIHNHALGVFYFRFLAIGGCFLVPTFVHFIYCLFEVDEKNPYKIIIRTTYTFAAAFAVLYQTPAIMRDILYTPGQTSNLTEVAGALSTYFYFFLLFCPALSLIPYIHILKDVHGLRRQQVWYAILATSFGFSALFIYMLNIFSWDFPWLYYPLQSLVNLTFSFAIFKYELLPVRVAIRRAFLLIGIYVGLSMVIIPVAFRFYNEMATHALTPVGFLSFSFLIGIVFSLGVLLYSMLVRHLSIFHDKWASYLTHELKTPLSAIQSANDILEEEIKKNASGDTRAAEYLELIHRNTERLRLFIASVLDYSQSNSPTYLPNQDDINIKELCTECLSYFPILRERVSLACDDDIQLRASKDGLSMVINNLISNAFKFCPNGRIFISVKQKDGWVITAVRDEGVGIDEKSISRIFDPFFKKNLENTNARGSGLGLSVAKAWVEAHSGKIWAESDGEGKGATVTFTLPVM